MSIGTGTQFGWGQIDDMISALRVLFVFALQAILIVHGAWHQPAHYQKLTSALIDSGFHVAIPHLPTCSNIIPPSATFEDDCEVVRSTATSLADDGKKIVVLMHSYGGVVGTNSLRDLSHLQRSAHGRRGGVVRLIYMCSFMLPLNGTLCTPFSGELPPIMEEQLDQGTCTMQRPEWRFYEEVADVTERGQCLALLTWHSAAAQKHGTVKYAAYRDIPSTYLVCEKDNALDVQGQRAMIQASQGNVVKHGDGPEAIETGGVFSGEIHVVTCRGGHSPWLSCLQAVVACVRQAVQISTVGNDA